MSKSASGTKETPGRNISVKSGLNKSILDQGWYKFRRQFEYKLAWNGGILITVPPKNTSRTCPECGYISAENRQTQAGFRCMSCGFEENADLVGAINILRAGHALIACEVNGAVMPSAAGTHRRDQSTRLWLSRNLLALEGRMSSLLTNDYFSLGVLIGREALRGIIENKILF